MKAIIRKDAQPLVSPEEWAVAREKLKTTSRDPAVGISIVPVKIENDMGIWATVIDPGKAASIHFHPRGDEEYQIISGRAASIKLLTIKESATGKTGPDDTLVQAGDSFTIPPNCMHQLVNTGAGQPQGDPLVLIFRSTTDHLTDENRVLTPNWELPASFKATLIQ